MLRCCNLQDAEKQAANREARKSRGNVRVSLVRETGKRQSINVKRQEICERNENVLVATEGLSSIHCFAQLLCPLTPPSAKTAIVEVGCRQKVVISRTNSFLSKQ